MAHERKALDTAAVGVMVLLTALWGFQQVAIKIIAADVSLVMQGAIRSVAATLLLVAWSRLRGVRLFQRDGTLPAGLVAGALFGIEFVFIYAGLAYTNASRMAVFIYLTPPLTALGLHFLVRSERLAPLQWAGVGLAFAGILLAFLEGFLSARATWVGDLCGVAAAFLWAATTIVIRTSRLSGAAAEKTAFYQLAMSAPILLGASLFLLHEPGVVRLSPLALASLAYQSVVIAFASYLAWFWLLTRYLAARLSVLSFLTPLFGVAFGVALLSEPLRGRFLLAAVLVGAGIVLVNRRR
jgi:drug/metabolite transporter (DMT)-like permease